MLTYIVRRLLIGSVTLLLITFVVYGLLRQMPGDPTLVAIGEDPSRRLDAKQYERLRKIYGLDQPWPIAYVGWLGKIVRGDLGYSLYQKQPVTRVIAPRIGPTLLISVTSLVLSYLFAIPMGLYSTVRSGHTDERIISTLLYMLYSFPAFVAALFLQILFAVKLGWLPLLDMTSNDFAEMSLTGKAWDIFKHALMPVACYTYGSLAYETRFIRSNTLEVIRQDYIRTARAKGVGPKRIILHHAFRNTLIPLVTLIGLTLPSLLSGAVILEQIFNWPGMGRLFFESIRARDYFTTMGLTLIFSLLTLAAQLLADVVYALVDPRVSYS